MPTERVRPEVWLAFLVVARMAERRFIELTGMTLAEWDERNYQRIMSG
jgi:hypothetical protein